MINKKPSVGNAFTAEASGNMKLSFNLLIFPKAERINAFPTKIIMIIAILLCSICLSSQVYTPVDSIKTIQDNISYWNGQRVSIRGVVTIGAGVTNNSQLNVYIQDYPDDSGKGIQVFRSGSPTADHRRDLVRGNLIRVNGTIEDFTNANGATTTEIIYDTYEVLDRGYEIPFVALSIPEARDFTAWEGTRVLVAGTLYENPTIAGVGYNINIQNTTGARIIIRVWDTTGITGINRLRAGIPIEVYGVISEFNNASQILPGYQDEIVIKLTQPEIGDITINPANPFIDQEIRISAEIIDYDGYITSAVLSYRLGTDTTPREQIDMTRSGSIWSAIIPPYQEYDEDGEGQYIFKIVAIDDSLNTVDSGERKIEVTKRRPIISNIVIGSPEPGDSLWVRANIIDAGGKEILEAKVLYSLNYSQNVYSVEMENTSATLYQALLPGFSSGTIVYLSFYALNEDGLHTLLKFDDNYNEYRYIYPVQTSTATLMIAPKAYNIYEGAEVEIIYYAKLGDLVIIRIYNSEGKLVHTPLNKIQSNNTGNDSFIWTGRDSDFRLVQPGLYICHLEVLDRVTGKKRTDKAPIVIGTRLK